MLNPICLNKLTLSYGEKSVVDALNLTFQATGISFLLGHNGAGKTQLLKLIHGINQPSSGTIKAPVLNEQAYLQQQPILLNRSVMQNLQFIRASQVCRADYFDARINDIIQQLDLAYLLSQNTLTLSGGEKKRVALARLLLQEATLYLIDEPSANVDLSTNQTIESVINHLADTGKKIILTLHDLAQLKRLFQPSRDEIIVLRKGRLVEKTQQLDLNVLIDAIS
ncbi:ATP-binding cassette domain-containing protein [Ostreibacterium oceani]|uniref:ATP-binding cassette domain-containing protein n=1 Tax=Ostreibacterium oceani TaxID=2654998 RepID=A0A6N7EW11_9GAMM|nr:ATP-binding cassette domain-containing protein [Ostreibacterium oceani]MPV86741.1 ATP-binding cassette domain-containing protein [Ostreibacterium oceani]